MLAVWYTYTKNEHKFVITSFIVSYHYIPFNLNIFYCYIQLAMLHSKLDGVRNARASLLHGWHFCTSQILYYVIRFLLLNLCLISLRFSLNIIVLFKNKYFNVKYFLVLKIEVSKTKTLSKQLKVWHQKKSIKKEHVGIAQRHFCTGDTFVRAKFYIF